MLETTETTYMETGINTESYLYTSGLQSSNYMYSSPYFERQLDNEKCP